MSTMPMMIPLVSESDLKSYQMLAKIVASNPHWRQLGGETRDKKLSDDEVISNILCVMLLAREIGLPPMQAVSYGIYNIKGKFEISARGMNQLIRQRGHQMKKVHLDHEVCKLWGKRRDTGEEDFAIYHIEEAKRADLIKPYSGWAKNPQDMLFARALSRLARRLFADCIGGFYGEGELQEAILKKPVEAVEVPSIEEFNAPVEEIEQKPTLQIEFPSDISQDTVEKFIEECASTSGKNNNEIIKAANAFPSKFIDSLRKWEDKLSASGASLQGLPHPAEIETELQEIEV